ncbi:sporulation histidine kinase inhibitor Sda [Paenibacillus methanolicus]|uniref:Sporulation inhibitor A n=1 Tax=Paenibacillus methanolicus TaxID=582686 RepID=A0A5S5BXL7_9BACL|nr:sporulation histidine kinase inhibitor Sda [Paenibacillus methanolicus]TYP71915.1 sporulation inhibitor A [Paenibacillus methanolicus]
MKLINWADITALARAETDVLVDAYQDAIALGLSKDFIRLLDKELDEEAHEATRIVRKVQTGGLQSTSRMIKNFENNT